MSYDIETLNDLLSGAFSIVEANVTPFQKMQQKRRQTVAMHTARPAKQSTFYKHAVVAIQKKLRKRGEGRSSATGGGQKIAHYMMTKNGYGKTDKRGSLSLTGKGLSRNKKHVGEPASVRARKERTYDFLMGIQRKKKDRASQLKSKAVGAGA